MRAAIAFVVFALATAACSFPFCKDCKATVVVEDATIVINACVQVEYPSGVVTPCKDAGAPAGDDAPDESDEPDE